MINNEMTSNYNHINISSIQTNDEIMPEIDLKGHSVEDLAKFANVSVNVIKTAISMRQSQMMQKRKDQLQKSTYPSSITTERISSTHPSRSKQIEQNNNLIDYNFKSHKVSHESKKIDKLC